VNSSDFANLDDPHGTH